MDASCRAHGFPCITQHNANTLRRTKKNKTTGAKVAVVELPFDWVSSDTKGGVGGTCVLRGCVPKKLMVYASQYAEEFKGSAGFGCVVCVCLVMSFAWRVGVGGGVSVVKRDAGATLNSLPSHTQQQQTHATTKTNNNSWDAFAMPDHSWTQFLEAKRKELMRLNGAYKNTLKSAGVELLEGRGVLVDAHTVDVDGKRYTVGRVCGGGGGCW